MAAVRSLDVTTPDAPADTLDPFRLPRTTVPVRYDVALKPDLDAATFSGTVDIAVTTTESSPYLVMNAIELEIDGCMLDGEPAPFRLEPDDERLFVLPTYGVQPGEHVVSFEFRGILNDQLRGFHRSTYRDDSGNERVIATTQMQSTDCRRSAICFSTTAICCSIFSDSRFWERISLLIFISVSIL